MEHGWNIERGMQKAEGGLELPPEGSEPGSPPLGGRRGRRWFVSAFFILPSSLRRGGRGSAGRDARRGDRDGRAPRDRRPPQARTSLHRRAAITRLRGRLSNVLIVPGAWSERAARRAKARLQK